MPTRRHRETANGNDIAHAEPAEALPVFDGFPYLMTRVVPALYHVILLPGSAPRSKLIALARAQARANRLDTCLALAEDCALYISPDGTETWKRRTPRGGILVTGKLRPPAPIRETPDFLERAGLLRAFAASRTPSAGCLFGDLTKGGRPATADELERLSGAGPEGVPRGLERCPGCGDWAGACLDPNPDLRGQLITVHCRCANDNLCAACGEPLYEWKLNANYFDRCDGRIWHVPGFCGLSHRCAPPSESRQSRTEATGAPHPAVTSAVTGAPHTARGGSTDHGPRGRDEQASSPPGRRESRPSTPSRRAHRERRIP